MKKLKKVLFVNMFLLIQIEYQTGFLGQYVHCNQYIIWVQY